MLAGFAGCQILGFSKDNFIAGVPHGPINFVLDLSLSPLIQGRRVGTENREKP